MKNLFKHASSSWVRYNKYEWKKDKNNKYYITPAPDAMPQIYDPLKDYKPMVLDALNIGLMIRTSTKRKVRDTIMAFVSNYGLLGLMTALPTTSSFMDYEAVYLPKNSYIREESMPTEKYLELFYPFDKLDLVKKGMESSWNINEDRTMQALALTFSEQPMAMNMSFQREYAERLDWIVKAIREVFFPFIRNR